ncbi:hypothetical protein DFH94DRAFT_459649 [Russula ochroleuca]|uniref:Secreted protein n=1 Tax=Russula ochroleuca TaxID=152965 RepID=A0A9P5T9F0_9AGAM|nr:hypothetical protein DFH94DRAFT_459649 [Russula ochroleuca]
MNRFLLVFISVSMLFSLVDSCTIFLGASRLCSRPICLFQPTAKLTLSWLTPDLFIVSPRKISVKCQSACLRWNSWFPDTVLSSLQPTMRPPFT